VDLWVYFERKEEKKGAQRIWISLIIKTDNRLRWYGRVERKDDDNWIKHCTVVELAGMPQKDMVG